MSEGNAARRKVLVTGGGSGLGKAIAERLARTGDEVLATVRDPDRARRMSEEAARRGLSLRYRTLELGAPEQIARLSNEILAEGGLDVLVNNAGSPLFGPIEEIETTTASKLFEVNVLGPLDLTRRLLPMLRERQGAVLFVGSLGGRFAMPFQAAYSSTKAAIASLSDALRIEVAPFGVRVSCIEPGDFPTNVTDNRPRVQATDSPYRVRADRALEAAAAQERGGPSPEWVARAVERLSRMKNPPARQVVGRWARTLCALQRLLPDSMREAGVRLNYGL